MTLNTDWNQILIRSNIMKKHISATLYQKCLILCSQDSTKCAPKYKPNSFVTITTYWVPDLPNIKGFSGQLTIDFDNC